MTTKPTSTPSKPTRWKRWIIEALIILGLILLIRAWQHQDLAQGDAPLLSGTSLAQTPLALSNFKGQPVLVHFFAPWCPVCTAMHSNIAMIQEHYPIIFVASSTEPQDLDKWIDNHPDVPKNQILLDRDGQWLAAFGSKALPTDVFIDTQGKIHSIELGYSSFLGLWIRLLLCP